MKVSRRRNRKLKKPVLIVASVLLVALSFILVRGVVKAISNNGPLALEEKTAYKIDGLEGVDFNVTLSNSKSLNKVIDAEILRFIEENEDVLNNIDIDVIGEINETHKFLSLKYTNASENIKDVYKISNIDLNNYEVIDNEGFFHDDLKGLSMLVREGLAKDEELTYNKTMYLETLPEEKTFKHLAFTNEGISFVFEKDRFDTKEYKETSVAYSDVLPYLSDDVIKRLDKDFVRPDLSNVRYIDPSKPMVAVTYDDGPRVNTSLDVAKYYTENNARLSFFWLGQRIDESPEIVKEIFELGHETANHSQDHSDFNTLSAEDLEMQTNGVNEKIKKITGQDRVLIRAPYGSANDEVKAKISSPLIMWTIDTEDWKNRDEKSTLEAIKQDVKDGSIILMHDIYESSINAGKKFLDEYKDQYQFLTVTELHQYKGITLENGKFHFGLRGY